ncbi:uncharacterized protein LOC105839501 isoform X3 [Monomorium pharaonis]|uniref:uncharacterized protein LOC105839501 isoform X3 n=1 Tax=Monomorium pharaonis TaxID=307658 RepID=UPI0017479FF0|nr:uncharacterized protein LOC105839501 isoform X3 [Monomorium pharaonis]
MSCVMIGILMILASIARICAGCPFCARQQLQQLQLQRSQSQQFYRTIGSPRPFGVDRPNRVQEFNRTGVLHPEYQIPATIRPGNVSQFYYLNPREGPPLTLLVSPCSGPISWTVSYVEPPGNDQDTEGAEDQNFTIPKTRAGLYWFEIKSMEPAGQSPGTVLLYATSSALDHISDMYVNGKEHRHRTLRFQQRRSKRRLTISWGKSHVDPHLSNYCLAVTSGTQPHPSTLCAAQNVLKAYSHSSPRTGSSSKEHYHRGVPEGLYCVRQTKLTLHRMRYDTTYNFTLYVVNTRNNVSNRVATDAIKFKKTPELTLRTGRYTTANLRKTDGFVNFRYRPPDNTSSTFHILPCGGGIVKAKLSGQGILREKEVVGYASLRVPPLPPGKMYTLRISATPQELVRVSTIKVLATQESSTIYPQRIGHFFTQIPSKNPPREYRSLRTCHEVTIGVESAGAAKYCILVKELRSSSSLSSVTTVPDQCGLHRRRRSEYTFEVCEEKPDSPKDRALTFTLRRLQPGKAYLLQVTAQLKGQSLSYPLLGVRTRRSCVT